MPIARKPNSPFWWYDVRFGGRRYRGSTKTNNKQLARHREAELLTKLRNGDELPQPGRRAPLLRDFLEPFLASFEANRLRSENTKRYYRNGARLLRQSPLAECAIDRITTSNVASIQWPHSAYSANNAIRTLRRLLGYAVELQLIRAVPRMHLQKEKPREDVFTPEQEALMLKHLPRKAADVFILCMDTGVRPEEVSRMRWENVDWLTNRLRIPHGKTDAAARELGMSSRVHDVLKRRMVEQEASKRYKGSPWVFPSSRARSGHMAGVQKAFRLARIAAGLPDGLVLYSARHTFGTEFMAASGNLKMTMVAMGHADVKTSMRYQHPATDQVSSVMDARNLQRQKARERHNQKEQVM